MFIKAIALTIICLVPLGALAESFDPSLSVFRFQKTMAERGDIAAQFKLGQIYESGAGVEADVTKARYWYNKAATQEYKPAQDRLVYLDIKHNGFSEDHKQWLQALKNDARSNEGEALFLLGQMYADGTGVNKSLTRSLKLLRKASAENVSGSDAQIARVEHELYLLQQQFLTDEDRKKLPGSAIVPADKKTSSTRNSPPAPRATTKPTKPWTPVKTIKNPPSREQSSRQASAKSTHTNRKTTAEKKAEAEQIAIVKARLKAQQEREQNSSSHPMDMICSGENRFSSGCR